MTGQTTATVRWFADHKGYGYLRTPEGVDVYVHHSAITGDGFRTLQPGQVVSFTQIDDGHGPTAADVHVDVEPA